MIPEIIIYTFLLIGVVFNGLAIVGLLRFPDVYTRLHATTKCTTFGSIFTSLAVIVYGIIMFKDSGDGKYIGFMTHTFIALVCLMVANATGAHAIARAAHKSGIYPKRAVIDELELYERSTKFISKE